MPPRDLYIDRLRSAMTALVILHHTATTYGGIGGWFYNEVKPSSEPSSLLLTMFCATNQAYFMGFFFLLAGYFTPGSLERKGYARFIGDRFLRLGLPLLAFGLILGPITEGIANVAKGKSFWGAIAWLWSHKQFSVGPLWFAEALLLFGLGYCVWRAAFGAALALADRTAKPIPAYVWWLACALGVGAVALLIRQAVPTGQPVFGLQLGFFSSYVFLFALGLAAWRYNWLSQLRWKQAWPWVATAFIAWPFMLAAILISISQNTMKVSNFSGGFSWQAILYAFWEPFVAWGLIVLWLLVFRARLNQPSAFWTWLNRRAYAVYIIHPVILVGIAGLLRGWVAAPLVKWGVVGTLAVVACWLVADPLVRLPGIKRVV